MIGLIVIDTGTDRQIGTNVSLRSAASIYTINYTYSAH
jgi:hypothetical protein